MNEFVYAPGKDPSRPQIPDAHGKFPRQELYRSRTCERAHCRATFQELGNLGRWACTDHPGHVRGGDMAWTCCGQYYGNGRPGCQRADHLQTQWRVQPAEMFVLWEKWVTQHGVPLPTGNPDSIVQFVAQESEVTPEIAAYFDHDPGRYRFAQALTGDQQQTHAQADFYQDVTDSQGFIEGGVEPFYLVRRKEPVRI